MRELPAQYAVQQIPVRVSPSVDTLLDIAHYQVHIPCRIAVGKKRMEVVPLDAGSILKLIQEEVVEPDTYLFINERSIATVNDTAQNSIGIIQAHDILLLHQIVERFVKFSRKTKCKDLTFKYSGCPVNAVFIFEQFTERIQRAIQQPLDLRHQFDGLGLREPLFRTRRLIHERIGRDRNRLSPFKFNVLVDLAHELAVEIISIDTGILQDSIDSLRRGLDLIGERVNDIGASVFQCLQALLRVNLAFIHMVHFHGSPVLLALQRHGSFIQIAIKREFSFRDELVFHAVSQPVQKFLLVFGKRIQNPVNTLFHKGFLVEFHLIGCELSDFPREGFQGALEEFVNGTDRKSPVVIQDIAQHPA